MIAYLDAGSLGLIFTALAGGIAGVAMLFRMYGNKFLGIFSKERRERARRVEAELRGTADSDDSDEDSENPDDSEAAAEPAATETR